MLKITIDKTEFDSFIKEKSFKTIDAVSRATKSAATSIRTVVLKELSTITKIPKKDLAKGNRVIKKVKFKGASAVIIITRKHLRWRELHPEQLPAGVVYFNPLSGSRVLAKNDPKTFLAKRIIFHRVDKKRLPIKVFPGIPIANVWKKRVGNRLDSKFLEIFNKRMKKQLEKLF